MCTAKITDGLWARHWKKRVAWWGVLHMRYYPMNKIYLGYIIYIYILYDMYMTSYGIFISYRCLYDDLIQSISNVGDPSRAKDAAVPLTPHGGRGALRNSSSSLRRFYDACQGKNGRMVPRPTRISRSTLGWVETLLWKIDIPSGNLT